jgi:hypothetical protein
MVPGGGIEPPWNCFRRILSLLWLPISPLGHNEVTATRILLMQLLKTIHFRWHLNVAPPIYEQHSRLLIPKPRPAEQIAYVFDDRYGTPISESKYRDVPHGASDHPMPVPSSKQWDLPERLHSASLLIQEEISPHVSVSGE